MPKSKNHRSRKTAKKVRRNRQKLARITRTNFAHQAPLGMAVHNGPQLKAILKKTLDHTSALDGIADDNERAVAGVGMEIDMTLHGRELNQHARHQHYLTRLAQGRADECEDCFGDIPKSRRKAEPNATTCRPCQEKREFLAGEHIDTVHSIPGASLQAALAFAAGRIN